MATTRRPLALLGARLLDPASGRDEKGGLLVVDGRIAEVGPGVRGDSLPEGCEILRCEDHCLAPGLIYVPPKNAEHNFASNTARVAIVENPLHH